MIKKIKTIKRIFLKSTALTQLGHHLTDKIKLFFFSFLNEILIFFFVSPKISFSFSLNYLGYCIKVKVCNSSDLVVLREVFIKLEYSVHLQNEPEVIIDIGSNTGWSILFFRLKYPQALILGYEPDPFNYQKLFNNVARLDKVKIFNLGLADKDGINDFYCNPRGISSSIVKRQYSYDVKRIHFVSLDTVIKENHLNRVDLIKFDVEGGEYDLFKNFQGISIVKNIVGEVHLDLMSKTKSEFYSLMENFKITESKISDKRYLVFATNQLSG